MKTIRSFVLLACCLLTSLAAQAFDSFSVQVQGQGKPVLLIPGLMSDPSVWRRLASELQQDHQLHLIHIAGFAGKPAIDGALLPKVQQELLSYIRQQQLQQPALIGHSLGAFVAFSLASSAPAETGPVIAVDGLPYLAPIFSRDPATQVADVRQQAEAIRQLYQQMDSEALRKMTLQGLAIQARREADQQKVLAMAAQSNPKAVGQAMYELLTTDLRPDISRIRQPVLLLGASGALPMTMRKTAEDLYRQQLATLPGARLDMNSSSRHFIMYDEPVWLNHQVREFLQERP